VRLGGDADELRDLVERLTHQPLPLDWLDAIASWSNRSSRLRLVAGLLLMADREQTVQEALARSPVRDAVLEQLSPRHIAVAGQQVAALLTDLAQAGLPVEIDPGLRLEPADPGRAATLANGAAETAWVVLEVLRRLAPEVVSEQRDLQAARAQLDGVLSAGLLEALDRRATTIVAAIANRRRPRARRGVV
jgi:hypothetical protein